LIKSQSSINLYIIYHLLQFSANFYTQNSLKSHGSRDLIFCPINTLTILIQRASSITYRTGNKSSTKINSLLRLLFPGTNTIKPQRSTYNWLQLLLTNLYTKPTPKSHDPQDLILYQIGTLTIQNQNEQAIKDLIRNKIKTKPQRTTFDNQIHLVCTTLSTKQTSKLHSPRDLKSHQIGTQATHHQSELSIKYCSVKVIKTRRNNSFGRLVESTDIARSLLTGCGEIKNRLYVRNKPTHQITTKSRTGIAPLYDNSQTNKMDSQQWQTASRKRRQPDRDNRPYLRDTGKKLSGTQGLHKYFGFSIPADQFPATTSPQLTPMDEGADVSTQPRSSLTTEATHSLNR
jgi:hypothetical protein